MCKRNGPNIYTAPVPEILGVPRGSLSTGKRGTVALKFRGAVQMFLRVSSAEERALSGYVV